MTSETGGSRVREGREEGGGMKGNGRQGEKERTRAGERGRHTHRNKQTGARVHGQHNLIVVVVVLLRLT